MNNQGENKNPQSSNPNLQQHFIAYLPFEVITDIIARLPVKPLLRIRSVAKAWRSLIDSDEFINLHISRSSETRSNHTLLLRRNKRLFTAEPDGASAAELPHPLMCYSNEVKVLGSCNGLLCISNVAEDIAIWNPATKTHRLLPHIPSEKPRSERSAQIRGPRVYGFGYDSAGDDYCLVRISQFLGLDCYSYESEVKVLSIRSNKWKNHDDMPYAICYTKKMGVYVSGFLHWVLIRKLEPGAIGIIVAMDFVNDSYREVPLPENNGLRKWDQLDLGVLDSRLCFVAGNEGSVFDVWVMMEYGVRDSWTKVASFGEGFEYCRVVRPLTGSKFGGSEVLFEQDNSKLFWYDLATRTVVKRVELHPGPDVFDACIILSSLAPVTPRSRLSPESEADKNNRRAKFLSEGFKLVL